MKILVIASVRCGGRYFCEQISDTHNLKLYHEPTLSTIPYTTKREDVIVKICPHLPFNYRTQEIVDYIKIFDKIFLLDRKNKKDHLISTFNMYENSKNMYTKYIWNTNKMARLKKSKEIEKYKKFINNLSATLVDLSEKIDEDIIYYEDLYYNTQSINLKGLTFKPDITQKLKISVDSDII